MDQSFGWSMELCRKNPWNIDRRLIGLLPKESPNVFVFFCCFALWKVREPTPGALGPLTHVLNKIGICASAESIIQLYGTTKKGCSFFIWRPGWHKTTYPKHWWTDDITIYRWHRGFHLAISIYPISLYTFSSWVITCRESTRIGHVGDFQPSNFQRISCQGPGKCDPEIGPRAGSCGRVRGVVRSSTNINQQINKYAYIYMHIYNMHMCKCVCMEHRYTYIYIYSIFHIYIYI